MEKQIEDTLLKDLFAQNIRSGREFEAQADTLAPGLISSGDTLRNNVQKVIEQYGETFMALDGLRRKSFSNGPAAGLLETLYVELRKLVPENFVSLYDTQRMPHVVRYVKAIAIRAQRALDAPDKDRQKADQVAVHTDRLNEMLATITDETSAEKRSAVEKYFWLIEEYKVSQYAQELKTVEKVSPKRLDKVYADILRIA